MSYDFKNGDVVLREVTLLDGRSEIIVGVVYFSNPADMRILRRATFETSCKIFDVSVYPVSNCWHVIGNVEHLLIQKGS